MLSVQECKLRIGSIIDSLPEDKLEELVDYAIFLSSRYSDETGSHKQNKAENSLIDFFHCLSFV
ncbi:MAG: hypothetical protein GTO45_14725 [Candidatus Aminicenantes bacterium]|nr:hypothetical protein [Candidatus Aminicenantes bacterium]NIM80008.1 hypothetical protein [Candidatus Aminicenantes bacterium]NIN19362.1 hypothetical protein [Candidatus Aminicenantes bacterium]NIN43261.1 hypothetical protein [Candidatus Aminicenantes bacterium]NIN86003.1 hypothetical protein [Candidatus Aminicenantes bacterium]